MNEFVARLLWTPPTVDYEEVEDIISVCGNEPKTVRLALLEKIRQIENDSGWACELTLTPKIEICRPRLLKN